MSKNTDTNLEQPRISTRVGDLSVKLITTHERSFLFSALALFGACVAYKAVVTNFVFDEIFTVFLSRITSLRELARSIPADGQPPLQYPLTHASIRLFGETEFGARLPEIVAYLAIGLLTYRIVRRHGSAVQSLFALALVMGADIVEAHASTARPYCLLVCFTAITFTSWQAAALTCRDRMRQLCGVSLGIAGAILSHHFGVIHVGLFLAVGEATRLVTRRRIDFGMLVAIVVGLSPLAMTIPLAHKSRALLGAPIIHSTEFWARPSLMNLAWYSHFVPLGLLMLTLISSFIYRQRTPYRIVERTGTRVPNHEWAAAIAIALLLPIQILVAIVATNYFLPRYAITGALGMALICAWSFQRFRIEQESKERALSVCTLSYFICLGTSLIIGQMKMPVWRADPATTAVSPVIVDAPGDLPIVVSSAFTAPNYDFLKRWWYSPQAIRNRLIYLYDLPHDLKLTDFVDEISLDADKEFLPLPLFDYSTHIESLPYFLLVCTKKPEYTDQVEQRRRIGWRFQLMAESSEERLYRVEIPATSSSRSPQL